MASASDVVLTTTQPNAKIGNSLGDRKAKQNGMTALDSNNLEVSSWEVKGVGTCQQIFLALKCAKADQTRSYIYIRSNNSLELNDTNGLKSCGTCCMAIQDNISVEYYDRAPYKEDCKLAPAPWCCLPYTDIPKVEVLDNGYMCCCVKIDPCCLGKQAVIMPFEQLPPPCCCCSNRASVCDNCFGMCGPPTGNPKIHFPFSPQPKDAVASVTAIQEAMTTARRLEKEKKRASKGAPAAVEMQRNT